MNNELMLYARNELSVPRADRAVAKQAKRVYDEVRLKTLQAQGSIAMAGTIMEGITDLNQRRQQLSGDDALLNMSLVEIQANTVRHVTRIQSSLFNQWS